MAKFYGVVGYAELVETSEGVWTEVITEKNSFGDLIQNKTVVQASGSLNDNVVINNKISIVANPYAVEHVFYMRYVKWMNIKWKVSNVDIQYPRLILTLGGVYNGQP